MPATRHAQVREGTAIVKERSAAVLIHLCDLPSLRLRVAESGGVNALIQLLEKGSMPARAHAATALAHLARNGQFQVLAKAA